MSANAIQVHVSRFEQNGQGMLVDVMNSSDIIRIANVDVRDEQTNPIGYQRHRGDVRCRRIAEFINKPTSALPGSILLNLRGSATFIRDFEGDSHGTLLIPNWKGAAWSGGRRWSPAELHQALPDPDLAPAVESYTICFRAERTA